MAAEDVAAATVDAEPDSTPPDSDGGEVSIAERPEGAAAAAILAAGIGAAVLGLLTTLAVLSEGVKNALQLTDPVGPLAGKTVGAVIAWLVGWAILHPLLRERGRLDRRVLVITTVLVGLGLLGTFPLFFELFHAE